MTNGHRRPLLAVVAAAALALSACGGDPAAAPDATASAPSPSSPPSATAGTTQDAEHNQADVMFSMMMIPHHAQAVQMSELVLAHDDLPPEVTDLAERIRDAQEPEIEQMSGWLEEWGYPAGMGEGMGVGEMGEGMGVGEMGEGMGEMGEGMGEMGEGMGGMGGMGSMSGMLSAEDMQALADATGPDAARLFLEGMIEHHRGAIEMSEREVEQGRHDGTVALAGQIIRAQQAEITEMEALLAGD